MVQRKATGARDFAEHRPGELARRARTNAKSVDIVKT
jgi:hypothetical protein